VKIGDFSACFLNEKHARGGVPTLQTKFPKTVEAPCGDTGEVESCGPIAPHAVRTQGEVIVVVNIRAGLTFVHGESGAEKARRERRNFGNLDLLSIKRSAFAAGCREKFLVNWIVDHADENFIPVS